MNPPFRVHKMFPTVIDANQEYVCGCPDRKVARRIAAALNRDEARQALTVWVKAQNEDQARGAAWDCRNSEMRRKDAKPYLSAKGARLFKVTITAQEASKRKPERKGLP